MRQKIPYVALDIDGVLIRGGKLIPDAKKALEILQGRNPFNMPLPFILLTNGGGVSEEAKAMQISRMFNLEIKPSQVVLSHSPMRRLTKNITNWHEKHVLIIGKNSCKDVAKSYGFKNAVLTDEILGWKPSAWPFRHNDGISPSLQQDDLYKVEFGGVLVFHDSRDWGRDLQIGIDVIRSKNGRLDSNLASRSQIGHQHLPIYFSNPDFVWANDFHRPRFAQGGFRFCMEQMFKELTGEELRVSGQFGKPFHETYRYALDLLKKLDAEQRGNAATDFKVYGVGDNVASDIVGANLAGWSSILVKTGVYQEGDRFEDAFIPKEIITERDVKSISKPKHIVDDVLDAIELIMEDMKQNI